MSAGNLNTQGQSNKNTPWQRAVLNLLKGIFDNSGGANTGNTPAIARSTGSITYPASTLKAIAIANVGAADGLVNGVILAANEEVAFEADPNQVLDAIITTDATGTTFLIGTVTP